MSRMSCTPWMKGTSLAHIWICTKSFMILLWFGCLQKPDNNRSTELWNENPQGGVCEKMMENSTAVTCMMAALKFLHETWPGQVQIWDCFNQWSINYPHVKIQFTLLSYTLLHFLVRNNRRGFSLWRRAYECYKKMFTAKYPQELFTLLSALLRHFD